MQLLRTVLFLGAAAGLSAQQPLTLTQAEAIAVKNHPDVSAALLRAAAANQVTLETRSAALPTIFGSVTGAGALANSRIAAGNLNNPVIYNRFASGVTFGQLITDFGRTSNLTESSRLHAEAERDSAQATREDILLQVDRAYYAALRAQTVSVVATQTVSARQTVSDQVTALANSKLKSGLDVSFANVNLAESKLLLINAQNEVRAAFADLSVALGYGDSRTFALSDPDSPPELPPDAAPMVQLALKTRPEIASLRAEYNGLLKFAEAEKDLKRPSITALASVGVIPAHEDTLHGRYGAAGVNMNIPIFNGRLFTARQLEAELRAQAAERNVRSLENRVARDVQVAWLNTSTAFQRLAVTAELLSEATLALDLAQTRYDLGLSSIVELSQAQLNKTSAEIASASAKYEYGLQSAVLAYQNGTIR
ncbi:MAG: TolC family protein [Acidobacteriota bacterium]|nr:TolC family protein [Acidobacteriota bacterium]